MKDTAGNASFDLPIARSRSVGRITTAALIVLVAALLIHSFVVNKNAKWGLVGHYLFSSRILSGLLVTLELTALSMAIALICGVLLAVMRLSKNWVIHGISWLYTWFFRGIPLLVLLVLVFNLALLYPKLSFSIPGLFSVGDVDTGSLVTPFVAAVLTFSLQESAYLSEIFRASIISVDSGQAEAAQSLGMTRYKTLRRIILPQAVRIAVPPLVNNAIILLKNTALVAVIAVDDLLYTSEQIYSRNLQVIPLLLVATAWYMFLISVLSAGQWALERRLGRSARA